MVSASYGVNRQAFVFHSFFFSQFWRTKIKKLNCSLHLINEKTVWRSILSARRVIENGTRWNIGNDAKVKIWHENWLPVNTLDADAYVSSLIDTNTKQWNRQLISTIFNQFEAKQIMNILIYLRLPKDKLIWYWEKHGSYSVRLAYHMLKDESGRNLPESSNSSNKNLWKGVWKIHAPNCVQNFIWRLAKDILPIKSRLERKGISLDIQCRLLH